MGLVNEKRLLDIHKAERLILDSDKFQGKTKICLLDFIGANNYFITDFGTVFHRKRFFPNKNNLVTRDYVPKVFIDRYYPYSWVSLETREGRKWFPTNQLLGWAFDPQKEIKLQYFIRDNPGTEPCLFSDYHWSDTPSVDGKLSKFPSRLETFMTKLYAVE